MEKKNIVKKEIIYQVVLLLVMDTKWEEDLIIEKVAAMFEIPTSRVVKMLNQMDF